ncbi:MAG: DNA repair protein RadC [Bacteroidales bacterium]|nr:DNA repair protein RadC [Bacteroidales bacterium]
MDHTTIKEWRQEDRPREKMLERGVDALTDAELLAILLRTGSSDCSAVDLARRLLDLSGNSLRGVSNYSLDRITAIKGIGKAKAVTLMAAFEAGRRSLYAGKDSDTVITDAMDVVRLMTPLLAPLDHEECWVIFLNRNNRIITKERLSSGGVSSTVIDVKMVVKRAVEKLASGIILVHNHPGGKPRPGKKDVEETNELHRAAALLDIKLLDHIIMAGDRYFSFSEENYNNR